MMKKILRCLPSELIKFKRHKEVEIIKVKNTIKIQCNQSQHL